MEFLMTRMLFAGTGDDESGSSLLGSLFLRDVSIVGIGMHSPPMASIAFLFRSSGARDSLNVDSSRINFSMSFNLLEDPSIDGERDLLCVTFLADIPLRCGCPWAGLWGVGILGMTFRPTTVGMVHTAGGDTAFTAESTFAPMTGIDSPCAGGTLSGFSTMTAAGSALLLSVSPEGGTSGLEGLFVDTGELKGVPLSVSLELSKQLLSRDDLLDCGPLELRLTSERLCFFFF